MSNDMRALKAIIEALRGKKQRLLVASHYNPDGDAVGAALGLLFVLESMGHEVHCYNRDPVPDLFKFLPGVERWRTHLQPEERFDATLIIDVYDMPRAALDRFARAQLGKIYVVDHHITHEKHGDLQYIDSSAAASGVLVYRFAREAGVVITKAMAENIYCGVQTDTGSFRYSSSTPEAFRIAGEMVEKGVEPWEFARRVYESHPAERFRLLGKVLSTLEVSKDGKCALVSLDNATMKASRADVDLTDGFINYPRSIAGVEVAIFLRENSDGSFKASMRSAGHVNVQAICERFGGGGHRNAAGCTLPGPYADAKSKILAATEAACR